jgi:zinc transporter
VALQDQAVMDSVLNEPLPWSWRFSAKTGPEWEWRHFDLMNAEAMQQVEANLEIPEFARQILTGMDETLRIETEGDVVAGVLPAFARTDHPDELVTPWRFAMTMKWLVTGRQHPTRTLVRLRELVQAGLSPADPAAVIDLCIGEFAREARGRVAVLDRALDEVEDRLMEAREAARLHALGGRLGVARREAADLKHAVTPLGRILRLDVDELPNWAESITEGSGHRMLHGVLDDIAAIYDQARALHDELTTQLAEETNRRLYVVSVVTLITGVLAIL